MLKLQNAHSTGVGSAVGDPRDARIAELEAALRTAQTAIAKCLKEGGRLDGGPDTDWWPGIVTAQQTIAAALRST